MQADIRNHATAVVSKRHLANALREAQISAQALLTNPPDRYPHLQIQCLHGQHRLRAGEEFLPPSDQCWPVDLYLNGVSYFGYCAL